jgi:ParB-like chromosome segregation protein Spo0J
MWKLELRKIKDLKAHSKNPRELSKVQAEHLKRSIDKFGLIEKPIVNLDNTIIGGHQRINILKQLKEQEVECWIPDHELSQDEVDELCIRLNKNTGDWDWDILANEWELNDLFKWGFNEKDFDNLMHSVDNVDEEKEPKKKLKICPECGHEFH